MRVCVRVCVCCVETNLVCVCVCVCVDVLYLDDDLRIHKTGEGNLFVQRRPLWSKALGRIKK